MYIEKKSRHWCPAIRTYDSEVVSLTYPSLETTDKWDSADGESCKGGPGNSSGTIIALRTYTLSSRSSFLWFGFDYAGFRLYSLKWYIGFWSNISILSLLGPNPMLGFMDEWRKIAIQLKEDPEVKFRRFGEPYEQKWES